MMLPFETERNGRREEGKEARPSRRRSSCRRQERRESVPRAVRRKRAIEAWNEVTNGSPVCDHQQTLEVGREFDRKRSARIFP